MKHAAPVGPLCCCYAAWQVNMVLSIEASPTMWLVAHVPGMAACASAAAIISQQLLLTAPVSLLPG